MACYGRWFTGWSLTTCLLFVSLGCTFCQARKVYVSLKNGKDASACGISEDQPCKSLDYVLNKIFIDDDIVVLDGGGGDPFVYQVNSTFVLVGNLSISGSHGMPVISGRSHNVVYWFHSAENVSLSVDNIVFDNMSILNVSNCTASLHISNVYIRSSRQAFVLSQGPKNCSATHNLGRIYVTMHDVSLHFSPALIWASSCDSFSVSLQRLNVVGSRSHNSAVIDIAGWKRGEYYLQIEDSVFRNLCSGLIISKAQKASLTVFNSSFSHIRACSDRNFGSSILILPSREVEMISLHVSKSFFLSNKASLGPGLALFHGTNMTVEDTVFADNSAAHSGGAVFASSANMNFRNCTFVNNSAGVPLKDSLNSSAIAGFGGALYVVGKGVVNIQGCFFRANSATSFGGALYHRGALLMLYDSYLSGSLTQDSYALQGDVIYAVGSIFVVQSTVAAHLSYHERSVLFYMATAGSTGFEVGIDFQFKCPVGYDADATSVLHAMKSNRWRVSSWMSYCRPCPKGLYGTSAGTILMDVFARWQVRRVTCKLCPPGGNCDGATLQSNLNFWGAVDPKQNVTFWPCPWGYCCMNQTCFGYDSCNAYRTGRLCGECLPGYSENLLSTACVPNALCQGFWFVPILGIGIIYIFALMYLDELADAILQLVRLPRVLYVRVRASSLQEPLLSVHQQQTASPERLIFQQRIRSLSCDDISAIQTTGISTNLRSDDVSATDIPYQLHRSSDSRSASIRVKKIVTKRASVSDALHDVTVSGILKILMFFYQAQLFSRVNSDLDIQQPWPELVKEFMTGLYNFKLTGAYDSSLTYCPMNDLGAVSKQLLKVSFIGCLFILVLLFYVFSRLIFWCIMRCAQDDLTVVDTRKPSFIIRLKCCYVELLLFGYSTVATCFLSLIHCVHICEGTQCGEYLYLNGNVQCFQPWQFLVIVFVACWLVPFFISLYLSLLLLRQQRITSNEFLMIITFPPLIIPYVIKCWVLKYEPLNFSISESHTSSFLLSTVDEPFRKSDVDGTESLNWECVLIFRRLVLICIYTFTVDVIARLYLLFIPLACFLVHHLHKQPFSNDVLNWLETGSLMLLLYLNSINLFWAYNYMTNVSETALIRSLGKAFLVIETLILLMPLLLFVCFIIYATSVRLYRSLCKSKIE